MEQHEICAVGDKVRIEVCRKLSRKKHHVIVEMVRRQPQMGGEPFKFSRLVAGHPLLRDKTDAELFDDTPEYTQEMEGAVEEARRSTRPPDLDVEFDEHGDVAR